jgi:hypothetical protein
MRARSSAYARTLAWLALGALIVSIPFRARLVILERRVETIYRDYTDILFFLSDAFLLATLVLWGASLALQPRRLTFGPLPLALSIAGVTMISAISTISSVDPFLSLYHTLRLILLGILYLFIVNECSGGRNLGLVIVPVALQVMIQSVVGVAQFLKQRSLGLAHLGEIDLDPAWSGVSIVWDEGTRSLRAYGLSDHPNILGGCLAFALLLMASWYVGAAAKWRAPVGSLVALGGLGLFLTFSRAAWLAAGGGLLFCLALLARTRQRRALIDWLSVAGGGLLVLLPFVWQNAGYLGVRLNVQNSYTNVMVESRSLAERDTLIDAANALFADHALIGVGVGAFPLALRQRFPDFPFNYQPVHNVLLGVATEIGIFGALFYLIILVAPWLALWLNRRRLIVSPALIGVSGTLLAITIVGFFDYYTWALAPGRLWQWFVWGMWGAIYQSSFTGAKHA